MSRNYTDIEKQYEMDMKVAEVLGWTEISHRSGRPPDENGIWSVPFYSTNEQVAMNALHNLGLDWRLVYTHAFDERYDVGYTVTLMASDGVLLHHAQGSTLAEAICTAIITAPSATK